MSQTDILGYKRDVKPNGQIFSSEFATISMGGRMSLVQQVQASYGQTVVPKFEVGSPTLYWLAGQPMGQVQIGRLVGRGGFFDSFGDLENSCGRLLGLRIGLDGTGGCTSVQQATGGGISFDGGMVANITASFGAGDLEVQEGATIQVASMRRG
jgi:hypothetical protein